MKKREIKSRVQSFWFPTSCCSILSCCCCFIVLPPLLFLLLLLLSIPSIPFGAAGGNRIMFRHKKGGKKVFRGSWTRLKFEIYKSPSIRKTFSREWKIRGFIFPSSSSSSSSTLYLDLNFTFPPSLLCFFCNNLYTFSFQLIFTYLRSSS